MKKLSNRFAVYLMVVAAALVLAVPTTVITTVEGQGGDPRNPKPGSTPNNSSTDSEPKAPRKPMTKAEVVKGRLVELFNLCKAGRYLKAKSYIERGTAEGICPMVKANTKSGYYFGKFMTQTHDDAEVVAWEVFYRGGADTKGEIWAFTLRNGKYMLVDIDRVRPADQ